MTCVSERPRTIEYLPESFMSLFSSCSLDGARIDRAESTSSFSRLRKNVCSSCVF